MHARRLWQQDWELLWVGAMHGELDGGESESWQVCDGEDLSNDEGSGIRDRAAAWTKQLAQSETTSPENRSFLRIPSSRNQRRLLICTEASSESR